MSLSNKLSCEAGSFSHRHHNPHRFLQSEVLRLYFPALELWVSRSLSLPSCSSWFIHTQTWDCLLCQPPSCCGSCPPWLPISTPSTELDECFFNIPWFLGCQTSIQFDFLAVLVVSCFKICCCPFGCGRMHSVSTFGQKSLNVQSSILIFT